MRVLVVLKVALTTRRSVHGVVVYLYSRADYLTRRAYLTI